MSSKSDTLTALLLIVCFLCFSARPANTNPAEICPLRSGDKVEHIDVFDGPPKELAYLAPDDGKAASSVFTVGSVYEDGRTVTVRCKYGSGFMTDIELKTRVNRCTVSKTQSGHLAVICQ